MRSTLSSRWIALLLALGLAASAAGAQTASPNPRQQLVGAMRAQLQLTSSQVTQVNAILDAQDRRMQSRMQTYQAQIRAVLTPQQLAILQQARGLDPATVQRLNLSADQVSRLKAIRDAQVPAVQSAQQETTAQINAILTPAQRTRFARMTAPEAPPAGR